MEYKTYCSGVHPIFRFKVFSKMLSNLIWLNFVFVIKLFGFDFSIVSYEKTQFYYN